MKRLPVHMDSSASDRQHSHHYNISTVRSKVAVSLSSFGYESTTTSSTLYTCMAVQIEEVNDAITFEQSTFSKIDESKTLKVSCRFH